MGMPVVVPNASKQIRDGLKFLPTSCARRWVPSTLAAMEMDHEPRGPVSMQWRRENAMPMQCKPNTLSSVASPFLHTVMPTLEPLRGQPAEVEKSCGRGVSGAS